MMMDDLTGRIKIADFYETDDDLIGFGVIAVIYTSLIKPFFLFLALKQY